MKSDLKAVSIGCGCGAVQVLLGLRPYLNDLTAIIAVTDTGCSTGKVRSLADLPAPGTLAGNETVFAQLIQHLTFATTPPSRALSDDLRTAYIIIQKTTS